MKSTVVTLPAYWASAIVNGDYSGLENDSPVEAQRCKDVLSNLSDKGYSIVCTTDDEPRFTWHYRLYDEGADCDGGEVLDYVALYN